MLMLVKYLRDKVNFVYVFVRQAVDSEAGAVRAFIVCKAPSLKHYFIFMINLYFAK